jgi:prepilin-type processing-associated H-X9-DG protein
MADKPALTNEEDMTSIMVFSRERRILQRVLLATLPVFIACLWIMGVIMAPADLKTMGSEYFFVGCWIALFLAFAFPYLVPDLSVVARRSYSLVCMIGALLLLNYCTGKRPPLTQQIDGLNQYLLPTAILFVCVVLWLAIGYCRYRIERPLPSNAISTGLVLLTITYMGFIVLDPVLRQARLKSNTLSCTSNLKQLELGVQMYAQDWDQKLPPATRWATLAEPYIRNSAIYHCPSAESPYSYASNRALSGISLNDVYDDAATVVHLFESNAVLLNAHGGQEALADDTRHYGGLNFGFLDGHVKYVSLRGAASLYWLPTSETGSPGSSSPPNRHFLKQ